MLVFRGKGAFDLLHKIAPQWGIACKFCNRLQNAAPHLAAAQKIIGLKFQREFLKLWKIPGADRFKAWTTFQIRSDSPLARVKFNRK